MGDNKLSAAPPSSRSPGSGVDSPRAWKSSDGSPRRHGAISRQLFSYSHYKSWSERMRSTWKKEDEEAGSASPAR